MLPDILPKFEQAVKLHEGVERLRNGSDIPGNTFHHPFQPNLDLSACDPLCLAMTTFDASTVFNYERLEFWGFVYSSILLDSKFFMIKYNRDAFLKMTITLHLFLNHSDLSLGQLQTMRSEVEQNTTLISVAQKHDIPRYMLLKTKRGRYWMVCCII